ncbi:25606_t:CDS:2, partial [Dentiscutata erythropus]
MSLDCGIIDLNYGVILKALEQPTDHPSGYNSSGAISKSTLMNSLISNFSTMLETSLPWTTK